MDPIFSEIFLFLTLESQIVTYKKFLYLIREPFNLRTFRLKHYQFGPLRFKVISPKCPARFLISTCLDFQTGVYQDLRANFHIEMSPSTGL